MTEPTTEAGRRLYDLWLTSAIFLVEDMQEGVLAIEAEARAAQAEYDFISGPGIPPHQCATYEEARADALREADIVKALRYIHGNRVPLPNHASVEEYAAIIVRSHRAILDPEPGP